MWVVVGVVVTGAVVTGVVGGTVVAGTVVGTPPLVMEKSSIEKRPTSALLVPTKLMRFTCVGLPTDAAESETKVQVLAGEEIGAKVVRAVLASSMLVATRSDTPLVPPCNQNCNELDEVNGTASVVRRERPPQALSIVAASAIPLLAGLMEPSSTVVPQDQFSQVDPSPSR